MPVTDLSDNKLVKGYHVKLRMQSIRGGWVQTNPDSKRQLFMNQRYSFKQFSCSCFRIQLLRKDLNASLRSSIYSSGCSIAAKCPPFGISLKRTTLYPRLATDMGAWVKAKS